MSPTHDQSRSNTLPPDGPCFLQTFAEVPPRDDEAVDSSWNNGLVEYADSDSDTDETSQSPLEHSEDRTATDLDKDSKIAALLKQMDELKKERNSLDEKLRQQQADWENRLYLKELNVKSLESKLAQTPASGPLNGLTAGSDTSKRVASLEAQVTKLQSTLTVKENETHKLESKLQRCRNEARDQERRLTKELDEQNVQYKLLKTEASNARHDLKHKSQKYLELQDDYSKLKKSFAEFRDQHRGSSRERHGESSRRRSDSRHRSSSSEAHNSIGVQTEADWTEYISGEMKEALNTVLQKMERETQQRIRQLEADLASANNKNEVVTREKTQLAIQLVELQEKSQFLREADRLSTLKDEKLAKLQAELDTLTLRFGQAKQEAAEEQQKLKDQVLELQQTVDKAKEAENSDIIEVNPMEELKKLRAKHEKLRQKMEQSEKNRQALVNEILQLKEGLKITANNHLLELRKIRADRDRQLQLVNHFTASATKQTEEITNLKKELKDSKDEYSKLEQTHQIVVHTMRMETESQETGLKDRVEELSEQVVNLENTVKAKDACILALTSNTKKYQEFLQQWTERVRSKAQRLRGRQCVNCRETAIAKGEDNQSTSQASQPHAEASETPTQSSPVPSPSAESSESQPDEGLAQRGATEQPPTKKSKLFAAI